MLSDASIKLYRNLGCVIIEPFHPEHLGPNSYDVTLGDWYYEPEAYWSGPYLDIRDREAVTSYWLGPLHANAIGHPYGIIIKPGNMILAHTNEVVGGTTCITTSMHARSSIARSGLSVCRCAGFGDVGYVNRWTMEIVNHTNQVVLLRPGMRIAQISFHYVGQVDKPYEGKYGATAEPWKPEDMLPRLHLDRERREESS